MGRESRVKRDRLCEGCGRPQGYLNAEQLGEHYRLCKRLVAANLVAPEPLLPELMAREPIIIHP